MTVDPVPWEGSTTRITQSATVPTPTAGQGRAGAKRRPWSRLSYWPRGCSLTLKITYRGGAEGWYLVECRGKAGVVVGLMSVEELMCKVRNDPHIT